MIMYAKVSANGKKFTIDTNCFWITIKDENNNIVFKREPSQDNWYDKEHAKLCDTLEILEKIFGIVYE